MKIRREGPIGGAYLRSLYFLDLQGDFESCADILITSYWLHVELGKNI
jgi:hypothetical protein